MGHEGSEIIVKLVERKGKGRERDKGREDMEENREKRRKRKRDGKKGHIEI